MAPLESLPICPPPPRGTYSPCPLTTPLLPTTPPTQSCSNNKTLPLTDSISIPFLGLSSVMSVCYFGCLDNATIILILIKYMSQIELSLKVSSFWLHYYSTYICKETASSRPFLSIFKLLEYITFVVIIIRGIFNQRTIYCHL